MWILLPLKPFVLAKQRLSGVLSPAGREQLAQAMAADVLTLVASHAATAASGIERVIVCSSDAALASFASSHGAELWLEEQLDAYGLSGVANAVADRAAAAGATALTVIHADLPLLCVAELRRFLDAQRQHAGVSIAPDRRHDGSNLLAWNPQSAFRSNYGPGSFARHQHAARLLELPVMTLELPCAAIDVDTPEDLETFLAHAQAAEALNTLACLNRLGLTARMGTAA